MEAILEYLPFIIPVLLLEIALAIFAIVHIVRHPRYRFGNMIFWIAAAIIFQIIGPIAYFVFGRGEDQ